MSKSYVRSRLLTIGPWSNGAAGRPQAKAFYERKKRKTNGVLAPKAPAHKLARACYHMLREHKPFDVARCFG